MELRTLGKKKEKKCVNATEEHGHLYSVKLLNKLIRNISCMVAGNE
jgi:hypothetical protein